MRRALDLFTVSTMDAVKSGVTEAVVSSHRSRIYRRSTNKHMNCNGALKKLWVGDMCMSRASIMAIIPEAVISWTECVHAGIHRGAEGGAARGGGPDQAAHRHWQHG